MINQSSPDTAAPRVRAAFINALVEEGTKEEVIFALQKQWGKNCALRAEIEKLRNALDEIGRYAKKIRKSCDLVGPYANDSNAMKVWQRTLYHEGKIIERMVRVAILPTHNSPGAGAEPPTSARLVSGLGHVGRTGGSIPPTGSALLSKHFGSGK